MGKKIDMLIPKPNGRTDWILLLFSGAIVTCLTAEGALVVRHNREIGEVRQQVLDKITDRANAGLWVDRVLEKHWAEVRDQLRSIDNRMRLVETGIARLEERGLAGCVVGSNTQPADKRDVISGCP